MCRASESRNAGFVFYIFNRLQIGLVFVLSFIISSDCHIIVKTQFIGFPHFTNSTVLEINISTSLFIYKREICVVTGPIALFYICKPFTFSKDSTDWYHCVSIVFAHWNASSKIGFSVPFKRRMKYFIIWTNMFIVIG